MFRYGLVFLYALFSVNSAGALDDVYSGEMEEDMQVRFQHLIETIRCPKCVNMNLASSDAPIAKDLRGRVYDLLKQGKTDQEIMQQLKIRYGDFVSYQPPVDGSTWFLWVLPVILLLSGAYLWFNQLKVSHKES